MNDNMLNFIQNFSKEFSTETEQIIFWVKWISDSITYTNLLKECIEYEVSQFEIKGKNFNNVSKNFLLDSKELVDEPSNYFKLFYNLNLSLETICKSLSEDVPILKNHIKKYSSAVINDVNFLKQNLIESCGNLMKEIIETKKKYNNLNQRYTKLKSELEEAHQKKKRKENDPKYVYNVTVQEKAEKKILNYIKEIEELFPLLENLSKELARKKESFNNIMKESLELVISAIFKNNIKINQSIFLINKEKYEIMTKQKNFVIEKYRKVRDIDIQLNDYVERKWAESKNILFESYDSLRIEPSKFDPVYLMKVCESLINYSTTFLDCMKLRQKSVSNFSLMINEFTKIEENFHVMLSKIINMINTQYSSFNFFSRGTRRSIENIKNSYDSIFRLYKNYSQFLNKNVLEGSRVFTKEILDEIQLLSDTWQKKLKEISTYKLSLLKFQNSRDKIHTSIKEILKNEDSKNENKLKLLKEEESRLLNSFLESEKKIKIELLAYIDNLRKTIPLIREKEYKSIFNCYDEIEKIYKKLEKIFDENIEFSKILMDISAKSDIYQDIKEIFEQYFTKFKINISDNFLEKIISKFLKKFDLEQIENGDNIFSLFNNYLPQNQVNAIVNNQIYQENNVNSPNKLTF
jgi:hypothetical protein